MNDSEILAKAISAQEQGGPSACVEILLKQSPTNQYVKQMKVSKRRGPWGRIVALTAEGTIVSFEAHRLIEFFRLETIRAQRLRLSQMRKERKQIHPVVSRTTLSRITKIAASSNLTISSVIDCALSEYVEKYA